MKAQRLPDWVIISRQLDEQMAVSRGFECEWEILSRIAPKCASF